MLTMYNVISNDGYVAQINGKDLRQDLWDNFLKLCKGYGTLVMGRKTYDSVQKYDPKLVSALEALPIKRIIISRDENFVPKPEYMLFHNIADAKQFFQGAMLSSGPTLNSALYREGLITKVILDKLPTGMCENIHTEHLKEGEHDDEQDNAQGGEHNKKHDDKSEDHLKDCIRYFDADLNPEMKLESTTELEGGIVRSIYTI